MNRAVHITTLAILLLTLCRASAAESGSRPITAADSVLAIYTADWGPGRADESGLILAIWPDGHIVWSEDRVRGGSPYHAGHIAPQALASLLSDLERDGLFADKEFTHYGPDSSFTTVLIRFGKKQVEMRSWHELAESRGKIVATARGLTGGGQRLQVLKTESAEYLYFRFVWNEIRARAAGLIPLAHTSVSGELVKRGGAVSWQETPGAGEPHE